MTCPGFANAWGVNAIGMISELMAAAFSAQQWRAGTCPCTVQWIAFLLEKYYDPMYEYQLQQREGRPLFQGDRDSGIAVGTGRRLSMQRQAELSKDLVFVGGGHAHALVLRMLAMDPIAGLRVTLISPCQPHPLLRHAAGPDWPVTTVSSRHILTWRACASGRGCALSRPRLPRLILRQRR